MSGVARPAPEGSARRVPISVVGAGTVALATLAGAGVGAGGIRVAAVAMGLPVLAAVLVAPQLGSYLWLLATPLIVGIDRGGALPVLRPNEALLLLLALGVGLHTLRWMVRGEQRWPPQARLDLALGLLVLTGSILPPLVRFARGLPLDPDDILYSVVLCKYLLLYAIFRFSVRTPAQVRACLVLAMLAAAIVAVVAILQVNDLLGVPGLLDRHYGEPFSGTSGPILERGTSTVASSFGVANIMTMCAAMIVAWLAHRGRPSPMLVGAGILFLLGCVAAGQFSGFIGFAIALFVAGLLTGRLGRLLAIGLPMAGIAAVILWPVLAVRLSGFETPIGLPASWIGRLDNLQHFVLPELSTGLNWLLGVRPSARLAAPESWRQWIYIESGYAWLLWAGGVPFLLAFVAFAAVALRDLTPVARRRTDAVGVAASAAVAALATMVVLMLFDPHLTMRGGADLLFPLLALSLVGFGRRAPAAVLPPQHSPALGSPELRPA
jgi:hypothetical protein